MRAGNDDAEDEVTTSPAANPPVNIKIGFAAAAVVAAADGASVGGGCDGYDGCDGCDGCDA